MRVCLFYKKLVQKHWVIEVEYRGGKIWDIQTADCINRNPHGMEFSPMEMDEEEARLVMEHIELKSSVAGASIVREEHYQYH